MKRFFVQAPPELHKKLQHLALDRGTSAEKLGGILIAEAVERSEKIDNPKSKKAK